MQRTCATALHHLVIALHVARNEDDLCLPHVPSFLEQIHNIRTSASLLTIPQYHTIRLDIIVDQTSDRRPERPLLIRSNPNEKPVGRLNAGRQGSTDTCACTDTNAATEHGRGVTDTSWHASALCTLQLKEELRKGGSTELQFSCPDCLRGVSNKRPCEVALNAADHVMMGRLASFANDSKRVVFHDRSTADTTQETLLHAALEAYDCNLRRWLYHH